MNTALSYVDLLPWAAGGLAVLLVVALLLSRRARRSASTPSGASAAATPFSPTPALASTSSRVGRGVEVGLTVVAAGIATAVSVNGMWRVFGDVLGLDGLGRALTAGFLEIALIVSALRARRCLREHGTVGVDGAAVWVIAVVSALVSAADADGLAKVVRLAAPLLAAWLWERGLAADRRAARTRQRAVIAWRWSRERLAVRVGLADPSERTTPEVDRVRRLARLTRARLRVAVLETPGTPWLLTVLTARGVRLAWATWRLQRQALAAVEYLHLGVDPAVPVTIRSTVAAVIGLRAATTPDALTATSPWTALAVEAPDQGALPVPAVVDVATETPAVPDTSPDMSPDMSPDAMSGPVMVSGADMAGDVFSPTDVTRRSWPVERRRSGGVGRSRSSGADTATVAARLLAAHPDWTTRDLAARLGVSDRTARRHLAAYRARTDRNDPAA
ncbi:MAG: hypothetical protein QG597_853 [Actinomycetota bacterium]|nr:hypothetical protein [Actinomycetota bacterium]